MSKLARALESAGLVTRTRDPKDPRAVQLALTDEGRDVTRRVIKVVQGLLDQLLQPLGGLAGPRAQDLVRDLTVLLEAPLDPLRPVRPLGGDNDSLGHDQTPKEQP